MAQSSVTLYGVADLGLVKSNGILHKMTGNGLMNNGSSRLGVRGGRPGWRSEGFLQLRTRHQR